MGFWSDLFGRKKPPPVADTDDWRLHQLKANNVKPRVFDFDFGEEPILFIVVDVETANADRSSICQIGIFIAGETKTWSYSTLVDPEGPVSDWNTRIHGISEDMLVGAPSFASIVNELRPIFNDRCVFGHSSFDKSAFNSAYKKYHITPLNCAWYDSIKIAQFAWPDLKKTGGYKLSNLAKFLEITFKHHDAAEDARAAGMMIIKAISKTGLSFKDLLHESTQKKHNTRFSPHGGAQIYEPSANGPHRGVCVCFTGRIKIKRKEAYERAALAGMEVKANLTRKVSILVVGTPDPGMGKSNKQIKAEEMVRAGSPIRIISEADFFMMLD